MKKSIILFSVLIVISVLLSGCGSTILSSTSSSSVKPIYDSNGQPVFISNDEYENIFTNANKYVGKFVQISGKIFTNPDKSGNTLAFQMYTDVEHYDKDVAIYYDGNDVNIDEDDYVSLTGYISGVLSGTNAFGGSVSAPAIIATKLEKVDYKTAVMPTLKEVVFNNSIINQYGCVVRVNKVEFAEKETRVYLSVENKSNYEFHIYTYSSKIIQGSKQYEYSSNYNADYEKLQTEIEPGVITEGVLTFPAMKQESLKFKIGGYSSNYRIDINDYVFNLNFD